MAVDPAVTEKAIDILADDLAVSNIKNPEDSPASSQSKAKSGAKARAKQNERLQGLKNTFNEQYAAQYGHERWHNSLLPALLAQTRYSALINRFADASRLPEVLQSVQGDLERVDYLSVPCLTVKPSMSKDKKKEPLPFPAPSRDLNNLTNYYLLDAASILATEALDIEPGHVVLDMCSAPGGKSVALCQRLFTGGDKQTSILHCNEISPERRKRLRNVLRDYLPAKLVETGPQDSEHVKVTGNDATRAHTFTPEYYDRVMIDAPCSSERHLLHDIQKAEESGNFALLDEFLKWTPGHSKTMAARQVQLVLRGLEALCFDGTLLYATCSLSDVENDGVISQVMKELKKRQKKGKDTFGCEVVKFKKKKFPIGEKTKYGWIVLPDVGDRWGPLFFSVLRKIELDYSDDDN
ncbi:hypothetical protein INT43_007973 [Umbelopsis isabellina]|uniref:NOL1/NOP2/Sun domain family member 4 n=1 Tax=Mortierella isabellina TaxID=91625 RepID=A0A8H7PQA4_MORIS|nr:hypothetical protein INT43_007973 [Umbelopsis isabellina]